MINDVVSRIFSNISDGIVILDSNVLEYTFFNEAYKKIYKDLFDIELKLGQTLYSNLSNKYPEQYEASLNIINLSKQDPDYIFRGEFGLKNQKFITTSHHILGIDGEMIAIMFIIKQVDLESLLIQGDAKIAFETIFNNSPIGMASVKVDGEIEEANIVLADFLGYTVKELKGMHFKNLTHPEDFHKDYNLFTKLINREIRKYTMNKRYIKSTGEVVYAQLSVSELNDGSHGRLIGTIIDQTKTFKSSEQLNLAISSSNMGVWDWDISQNSLIWDDRMYEIYGIGKAEFENVYEAWENSLYSKDKEAAVLAVQKALEGEKFESEFRIEHPSGELRYIKAGGKVSFDKAGNAVYMTGLNWDITEEKTKERDLTEANYELERFAYVASHDLQEPLRMIKQFSALLKEDLGNSIDDESKENLDFIETGVEKMSDLINGLLNYSRVKKKEMNIRDIDLHSIITDYVKYKNGHLGGSVTIEKPLPTIKADAYQMEQLFSNLISNGLKYNKSERPLVWIDYEETNDKYLFTIKDNGIGIKDRYHKQIFQAFNRLHSEREYPGTGIGLSVCEKIVKRNGGDIWLHSEIGKGSSFKFTIMK